MREEIRCYERGRSEYEMKARRVILANKTRQLGAIRELADYANLPTKHVTRLWGTSGLLARLLSQQPLFSTSTTT